jgi:hypothetical protein
MKLKSNKGKEDLKKRLDARAKKAEPKKPDGKK